MGHGDDGAGDGDDGSLGVLVSMGACPWELGLPWKTALIISLLINRHSVARAVL